jgi:putative flippase GtrA
LATQSRISGSELKRVGKFGIVGVINTIIDFGIYNVLSSRVGFTLVQANIVSTTVAMVFSFFANKNVVFKSKSGSIKHQAISFLLVTAFGLYILQTGTIELLTHVWLWPMNTLVIFAHSAGITDHNSFIIKNGAKLVGTVISLIWNYVMYKKVVFK